MMADTPAKMVAVIIIGSGLLLSACGKNPNYVAPKSTLTWSAEVCYKGVTYLMNRQGGMALMRDVNDHLVPCP